MSNKINESELLFRKVKLKEQLEFYQKAMSSVDDFATSSLGFSWDSFKRVLRINRLTFGLLGKIFMKNVEDFVILYNGVIVAGYTVIRSEERYELGNVFTIPEYQGKGIASILLSKVLKDYKDKPIRLDVNTKNEVAIHIYTKNDFKEINRTKEYIEKIPLKSQPFTKNYSARLFEIEDINKVNHMIEEIPKINEIAKSYKKSLKKSKKNPKRMETIVPYVLLNNEKIVGFGRAIWSKMTPNTASIFASAMLQEALDDYAPFLSFISKELIEYDIEKIVWNLTERTKPYEKYIKSYFGEPVRESIIMEKAAQKKE